jgi:hypothetical protein
VTDHGRLRVAARDYHYMRGLLVIPAGLIFIVCALGNWAWGPFDQAWAFVVVVAVVGSSAGLVNRYYNERYGRVTPSMPQQVKGGVAMALGIAVMVGGSFALHDLRVNAIPATFAVVMLVYYAAVTGLKRHHVAIWGTLLAAGALPVWTGSDPSNIGLVLCGVAVMLNGVLDHRVLVAELSHGRA